MDWIAWVFVGAIGMLMLIAVLAVFWKSDEACLPATGGADLCPLCGKFSVLKHKLFIPITLYKAEQPQPVFEYLEHCKQCGWNRLVEDAA